MLNPACAWQRLAVVPGKLDKFRLRQGSKFAGNSESGDLLQVRPRKVQYLGIQRALA